MQHHRTFAVAAALSLTALAAACDSDSSDGEDTITLPTVPASVDLPDTTGTTATSGTVETGGTATGDAGTDSTSLDDRLDAAADALRDGDFTTMLRLLELSGIADDIEGREITILAPTDGAFTDISADELENLLTNPTQIDDILKRHIVDELLTYDQLGELSEVTTISGETLTVENVGGEITVDGAVVTPPEADAVSGESGQELAVFGIDRVLLEGS